MVVNPPAVRTTLPPTCSNVGAGTPQSNNLTLMCAPAGAFLLFSTDSLLGIPHPTASRTAFLSCRRGFLPVQLRVAPMAAPAAVIRSYRGYFLWLALQYVAFLTVGNDDFFLEQWPVLVLVAIWLISELVAKFSWKLSKRSSGPLARGLEIFYVLAGVGFQKALLA